MDLEILKIKNMLNQFLEYILKNMPYNLKSLKSKNCLRESQFSITIGILVIRIVIGIVQRSKAIQVI